VVEALQSGKVGKAAMKPIDDPQPWLKRAEKVHGWLERIRLSAAAARRSLAESWRSTSRRSANEPDFVADADLYMIQQEPLRARVLLKSASSSSRIFIMWAAVSQIDEITRGEGKVIPSRQLQVLQSLDGGIVDEIAVQEGQVVEAGQIAAEGRPDALRLLGAREPRAVLRPGGQGRAPAGAGRGQALRAAGRGAEGRPEDRRGGAPPLRVARRRAGRPRSPSRASSWRRSSRNSTRPRQA
jgi:hypothetical protein